MNIKAIKQDIFKDILKRLSTALSDTVKNDETEKPEDSSFIEENPKIENKAKDLFIKPNIEIRYLRPKNSDMEMRRQMEKILRDKEQNDVVKKDNEKSKKEIEDKQYSLKKAELEITKNL